MIKLTKAEPLNPARPIPHGLTFYVLIVNNRRIHSVAHWLEERGWFTLVPLEKRWKIAKGQSFHGKRGGARVKRESYVLPLLPGKIVLGVKGEVPWLTIREHQHISNVLGVDGVPAPLRHGEPEMLRAISVALSEIRPYKALKPSGTAFVSGPGVFQGKRVEIGSLEGRNAIITAIFDGLQKVPLPVTIRIAQDDLEAA